MVSAAARSKAVVLLLFIHLFVVAPIVCFGLALGLCYVVQCFASSLVLHSSRWGRESWLLYLCCVLNVMSLLSFFVSSLRCHVLVCSM